MTLVAHTGYRLGIQMVMSSHQNVSECESKLVIKTGSSTYIQCLDNINLVSDEITSDDNEAVMRFVNNRIEDTEEGVTSEEVTVVFYSYAPKTDEGQCEDNSNLECQTSSRCISASLYEHVQKYNICQSPDGIHVNVEVDSKAETSFLGVAVFAGTLVLLFVVLITMNFIQKRSVCRVCRGLMCIDYDDTENFDVNHTSERPRFSLGDLPPNYSDLSLIGGYTNPALDVSDLPSTSERDQQSGIWMDSVNILGIPKTMSTGRMSVGSGTLPPSYSDAMIHKEEYNVHS